MSMKPKDRVALAAEFTDVRWRERFLELLAIAEVLAHSIIERNFKVSDELNSAILLTEAGKKVRDQLITKEQVEPKEANLLCLLELAHTEPLIDIERIDIDRLVAALSTYVVDKRIQYPLIFGRSLYDAAVALVPEERGVLKHEDTLRLLEGKQQGVFHAGPFLIGPFGIIRVKHHRSLSPQTSVPIQHCADLSCPAVHSMQLSTSQEASINKARPSLYKVLDQISKDPADWNGFVLDITEDSFNPYSIDDGATLPFLLGDAFSDDELRTFVNYCAEKTDGRLTASARRLGLHGVLDTWLEDLDRAQLLQVLLTEPDDELGQLLDGAIRSAEIEIPTGEVRRPVVNHRTRSGAWRLRPEASALGYRLRPGDPATRLLRLFSLIRSLFDSESADDIDELAWMLRGVPGKTTGEKLEAFFRRSTPREIVSTLVLGRRKNAQRVGNELHIEPAEDEAFVEAVLWKLGFPLTRRSDVRDEYWRWHQNLETFVTTASANANSTEEQLRSIASNYFVALERFLFDSLTFATWALLTDHVKAKRPFEYRLSVARDFAVETLNASVERTPGAVRNDLRTDPDLSSIVQGFRRLADHLDSLPAQEEVLRRPTQELPRFAEQTDIQQFPFRHQVPFLDLVEASRIHLPDTLRAVGRQLGDSGIMTARNGLSHAKAQRTPTTTEVNEALTKARSALRLLEEIGCVRTTFELLSTEIDAWGRSTTRMRAHGAEIEFSGPSSFRALGLPSLALPVYLMQGAVFAEPNEMLRFREGFESQYSDYWEGIPHRPERGSNGPNRPSQVAEELSPSTAVA